MKSVKNMEKKISFQKIKKMPADRRLKWKISKLESKISDLDNKISKLKKNLTLLEREKRSAYGKIYIQRRCY